VRARRNLNIGQITLVILVIGAAIVGGVWAVARQIIPAGGNTLRDTDTAFSIPSRVGQPAPEFTAIDADDEPYMFKPGDGRPKAIIFYMGFQ
jgi:hypothetical protein